MSRDDISKKDWEKVADKESTEEVVEQNIDESAEVEEVIEQVLQSNKKIDDISNHPSYQELVDKLVHVEQKAQENWDKSMRAMAEADNIRRRAERDVESAHKFGLEKMVMQLLPVIDSLEQALHSVGDDSNEDIKNMKHGIELTIKMFTDALVKFNVAQLNPVGEIFDPKLHEAMSMQEDDKSKPNTVLMVFQKGYTLNDRVIRPARVVVAK